MRRRVANLVIALVIFALGTGCSCGPVERGDDVRPPVPGADTCEHLELPIKYLREHELTVDEILSAQTKDAIGMRAMIALLGPWNTERVGRFRPVLRYLADRYERESPDGAPTQPEPPAAIVENAQELDAFLADGGCG